MALLISAALMFNLPLLAQSRAENRQAIENMKEYYYGPFRNGEYTFAIFASTVDFSNPDSEFLGSVILGGFYVSNGEARNSDYIGVILMDGNNQVVSIVLEKKVFRDFTAGTITAEQMSAQALQLNMTLNDVTNIQETAEVR